MSRWAIMGTVMAKGIRLARINRGTGKIGLVRLLIAIALTAGTAYTIFHTLGHSPVRVEVGQSAPDFTLPDPDGQEIRLSDYRGRGVLVNFWATWCQPCVNELPLLNEAYKLMDIEMLAVNLGEDERAVNKFVERYDLQFPIVLDRGLDVKRQYQVTVQPLTLLIDPDGRIIERHEGELSEIADILGLMQRIQSH